MNCSKLPQVIYVSSFIDEYCSFVYIYYAIIVI